MVDVTERVKALRKAVGRAQVELSKAAKWADVLGDEATRVRISVAQQQLEVVEEVYR